MAGHLFSKGDLREVMAAQEAHMIREIDGYDASYLLNISVDDLVAYVGQKHGTEAIRLREHEITVDQEETQIDLRYDASAYLWDTSRPVFAPATSIAFAVPFDGDAGLFDCCPHSFSFNRPAGTVRGNELVLEYARRDHDATAVKAQFDRDLANIRQYLGWIEAEVEPFNRRLLSMAREKINARRQRLLKDQGMAAALGFPIKQRDAAPRTYSVPDVRKKPLIQRPTASTAPFVAEPTLAMAEYDNILRIISNMALVLERSPADFRNMGEETLRQHFLVQLNGQYEGQATGETFNHKGKTDILIRADGANIFIAECKFWSGEKAFLDTINQLLGYVTWRDTKTAILIFSKNKDFSTVLASIGAAGPKHPTFKRAIDYNDASGFRWLLGQPNDHNREIIVTVMAFDVPG